MKLFLLLTLSSLLLHATAQTTEKYALIVAVSNYAPSTGWNDLNADNDIPLIKESLKRQGFKEENIRVIVDKEATKTGILTAMQQQLIGKTKPGDICVFHFSGHGQQVMDDNGDEADGYDEALVTYDSPIEYQPGVEKHLRDDVFGLKLEEIRKHLGSNGNLLVIVDACHSGTSTRAGLGNYRGTTTKYAPKGYKPVSNTKIVNEGLFSLGESKPGLAPMSAFFASAASELNQECGDEHCGSLSLAFSRALAKSDTKTSYRGLFDNVRLEMSKMVPGQTPNAEGDLDKEIFGGKALGKPNYYATEKIISKKKISIACGKIYSVFAGTTVSLYPSNTYNRETAKPIAKGTIVTAADYSSEVELDTELSEDVLKTAWIFLDEVSFGDLTVPVTIKSTDATLASSVKKIVSQIKQAKLTEAQGDVFIEYGAAGFSADSIYISTSGDYRLGVCSKTASEEQLASFISAKIAAYGRAAYLRNLNMKNEELNVVFEFVPIDYKKAEGNNNAIIKDLPEKTIKDASGNIVFQHDDRYNLRIINNGQERLYYNILEIQPDNIVNVLFPAANQQPMDCFINPGDTVRLTRVFRIGPPDGMNVLKLIAAKSALNLRQVFAAPGVNRGDAPKPNNPFEKLMQGINKTEGVQTRGSGEETIQPDAVNIHSIPFKIVPKKQ